MAYQARGSHGTLCVGYAIAAEVGRWSLETDEPTVGGPVRCTVLARIVRTNACLMAMGGFTALRLTMAPGVTWSWPIASITVEDNELSVGVTGRPRIEDLR